jgi:hypothetical protein
MELWPFRKSPTVEQRSISHQLPSALEIMSYYANKLSRPSVFENVSRINTVLKLDYNTS